MKCNFCGFEHEEDLTFCPSCGKQLTDGSLSLNPMADRISNLLGDGLFLVICILMSVGALVGLLLGDGLPVFDILFTIFLWICFTKAKIGFIEYTHVRLVSGTIFAYYIVNFVVAGLLTLIGLLSGSIFSAISSSSYLMDEIANQIEFESDIFEGLMGVIGGIFLVVFILIAVAVILINIFGVRKIHKFVKSLYESIEFNENKIAFAKAAITWLIVLGALSLAGALFYLIPSSPTTVGLTEALSEAGIAMENNSEFIFSAITPACQGLCGIFTGVLINKHILVD